MVAFPLGVPRVRNTGHSAGRSFGPCTNMKGNMNGTFCGAPEIEADIKITCYCIVLLQNFMFTAACETILLSFLAKGICYSIQKGRDVVLLISNLKCVSLWRTLMIDV